MNHIILFDTDIRESLLPFTYTRPVCDVRLGILTIKEKWQHLVKDTAISYITPDHLEPLYPIRINDDNYLINGALLPSESIVEKIWSLEPGEAIMLREELIAARLSRSKFEKLLVKQDLDHLKGYEVDLSEVHFIDALTDITTVSVHQIASDMELLGVGMPPHDVKSIEVNGNHPVYIDPSSTVERALLNASDGPIYIGPNAVIMDGATLRGPVAIGAGTIVKSHAFLSKGVCIGPYCEVGGEIKHSVLLGHSNKSHEGYLGDSVVGEWCNLGALTTNSNLRNTFTNIQIWDHKTNQLVPTGKNKCGFFMGDYSRTAIHTQINSGTVIGVSCHLFGEGIAKVFIPSFTWGGILEFQEYDFEKALAAAAIFRSFKNHSMDEAIRAMLHSTYEQSSYHRQLVQ